MTSLFDQLNASIESTPKSPTPTKAPTRSYTSTTTRKQSSAPPSGGDKLLEQWRQERSPKRTVTRRTAGTEVPFPNNKVIHMYQPAPKDRPYAYEAAGTRIEWKRPTGMEVLTDLAWRLFETMVAAAGMAIYEFFRHRRFHPGPGVRK